MKATVEIIDGYNIGGIGIVFAGIVKDGVLSPGMQATSHLGALTVKKLERAHKPIQQANPGDHVGLSAKEKVRGDLGVLKGETVEFEGTVVEEKQGLFTKLFKK